MEKRRDFLVTYSGDDLLEHLFSYPQTWEVTIPLRCLLQVRHDAIMHLWVGPDQVVEISQ